MIHIVNKEQKMKEIFEIAQKVKSGKIVPANTYDSIDDFANKLRSK